MVLESRFEPAELFDRWDDRTSPARFAGNDGVMDDIFMARRKHDRVFLIRKGRNTWDPFSTVFRGRIVSATTGSVLKGCFTKRLSDYFLLSILMLIDIYFGWRGYLMDGFTGTTAFVCIAVFVALVLLAIPLPSARKKYTAFLKEITDEDL